MEPGFYQNWRYVRSFIDIGGRRKQITRTERFKFLSIPLLHHPETPELTLYAVK